MDGEGLLARSRVDRWIGGLGVAEPVHNTRASASLILPSTKLFVVETI